MHANTYWPIALAVVADVAYPLASKQTPTTMNPFASLTLAYLVGATASTVLYYVTSAGGSILGEWRSANWTTLVPRIAIVGLEVGSVEKGEEAPLVPLMLCRESYGLDQS